MDFAISRLKVIGLEMLLSPIFFRRHGVRVEYRSIGLVRLCVYVLQLQLEGVLCWRIIPSCRKGFAIISSPSC